VLTNNITVAQSRVGFAILIGLQFSIAFMVVRWSYLRIIVNPTVDTGAALRIPHDAMRRQLPKPMCAPRFVIKGLVA
jgi:hypothetical protein